MMLRIVIRSEHKMSSERKVSSYPGAMCPG